MDHSLLLKIVDAPAPSNDYGEGTKQRGLYAHKIPTTHILIWSNPIKQDHGNHNLAHVFKLCKLIGQAWL